MRVILRGIVAAIVPILSVASAAAQDYAGVRAQTLYDRLREQGECEAALPDARAFWASPEFQSIDRGLRGRLLGAITRCAWELEDGEAAIRAAREVRDIDAPWADRTLLFLGLGFEDNALAVIAFNDLAGSNPAAIPQLEQRTVWRVLRAAGLHDASGAAEARIHDVLVTHKFEPSDADVDEALRFAHARALLRIGDAERARARIGAVTDPRSVLAIRVSKLFDPLRGNAAFEAQLDVVAASQRHLASLQRISAENPRRLASVMPVAQALRSLGRDGEALAVLDAALARAADPAYFEDHDEQINWAHNERAYVLYALNRPEEARTAFGESIAVGERGAWSVSQVINFATMLESEGRARDALEVIRRVGRASAYGDMWAASVRACAADQLSDAVVRDEAMTFLRANEVENPAALSSALLCINDLDGSAALFIRRLANPQQREGALLALQRSRIRENTALVRNRLMEARLEQVRQRPDVGAAVEAVGRIEDVPLYPVYWGDI